MPSPIRGTGRSHDQPGGTRQAGWTLGVRGRLAGENVVEITHATTSELTVTGETEQKTVS